MNSSYRLVEELFQEADIKVNGEREWDCPALDQFFYHLLRAKVQTKIKPSRLLFHSLKNRFFNLQSHRRAWQVGEAHYDIGNDFYQQMLDSRMLYTCGYWKDAENLNQAQEAKLKLACEKLGVKPGMRVLDIGCGWGSFMRYAAEKYGVECVGVTISKEQVKLAEAHCAGLPVTVRLQDYRAVNDSFDRIVSLGMFEHVGPKNHRQFMQVVKRCLLPNGLFLLHTIGRNMASAFTACGVTTCFLVLGHSVLAISSCGSGCSRRKV